jgi:hypothetical protein
MPDDVFTRAGHNLAIVVRSVADPTALTPVLSALGIELVGLMQTDLSRHGSGRIYRRRGVTHQASAPGEPPATDTGIYKGSWAWKVDRDGLSVGTPDERGPWFEFGTSRMRPRPHARPLFERVQGRISQVIQTGIVSVQRRAAGGLS